MASNEAEDTIAEIGKAVFEYYAAGAARAK